MAVSCPRCAATETDAVRVLELPPDVLSDEITLFVKRCPACDHRFLGVYQESRRGALGDEHWNYQSMACTRTAWERLNGLIARCPAPRTAGCTCDVHRELGGLDQAGRWDHRRLRLGEEPSGTASVEPVRQERSRPNPSVKSKRSARRRRSRVRATSAAGDRVAVGGAHGDVDIVDGNTDIPIALHQVFEPDQKVSALSWSPDGAHLACGAGGAHALRVIASSTGAVQWQRDHGVVHYSASGDPWGFADEQRPAAVHGLAYAPDGRVLVCGGEGEHVTLWSWCGDAIGRMPVDGWTSVAAVAISPDGHAIAAVDQRGAVRVGRLAPQVTAFVVARDIDAPKTVAFSADGHRLEVRDVRRRLRIVDLVRALPPGTEI